MSGDLHPGTPIGEYVIEGKVGEGSMGEVYRAVHPYIGKRAAVKVMRMHLSRSSDALARFAREAQAVGRLGHPNIIDAFSFGRLPDGRCYLVMEWLHGESLSARMSRGPLDFVEACDIFEQVCHALESAHANGIIHRDIKPDNVFLTAMPGSPPRVKLLDFGIAKLVELKDELTRAGALVGTPAYVSPEAARSAPLDWRADIYSLAVVIFQALTGRLPFDAPGMAVLGMHLNAAAPRVRQFRADVPPRIDELIARMLEKDPLRRPMLREVRHALVEAKRTPLVQMATGTPRPAAAPLPPAAPPPMMVPMMVPMMAAAPPVMPTPVPARPGSVPGRQVRSDDCEMTVDELIASLPREALPSADAVAALANAPVYLGPPPARLPPPPGHWRLGAAGLGLIGAIAIASVIFVSMIGDPARDAKQASSEERAAPAARATLASAVGSASTPIVEGLQASQPAPVPAEAPAPAAAAPPQEGSSIVIMVDDPDPQFELDGVSVPRAGRSTRLPVRAEGVHRITIRRQDRAPLEHVVSVARGQSVDVVVAGEPTR